MSKPQESRTANPLTRFISRSTLIEPHEMRAAILSFLFVFLLMAAYFIVRPARDAMSSDWTDAELSWLWTSTFFFSLIGVVVYGAIISRVRFSRVVPGVYVFFSATFFLFYAGSQLLPDPDLTNRVFYVWLSVFSLFHVSVFWSLMSGLYNREQAKRLFGFIATGASTGAIVGPLIPGFFTTAIGTTNLLLITAVMLLLPIPIIAQLERLKGSALGNASLEADLSEQKRLGKNPFSGFTRFVTNPYLLAIGGFIVIYVMMSTFIYFELRTMLGEFERDVRTQYWARIDLVVNTLTILIAIFATGRLATRFGMGLTLALIPALMVGGWLIVAAVPILIVLIGLQVARRAGNYAVTRPGREMLFTIVDDETRYKVKPVIDIVIYRGGDMVTAWFFTLLSTVFGLGLAGIALVAAAAAALWASLGLYLGGLYDSRDAAGKKEAAPAES